ncbi:thioredoxin-like protein [Leptodontidium sp. MPI-SDFR-AT-0119]|nr:thioredoxin-like protein [Leptodontidium sp. MPI-SDFR-AT-0119]
MSDKMFTLYTNGGTWAVRVHILCRELGIEFEEVRIDLNAPRPEWYLKINPLGKVPTITFGNEIMRESGVIVQYLSDLYPSHLVKKSDEEGGPLQRAKYKFFVDLYIEHIYPLTVKSYMAEAGEGKKAVAEKIIAAIQKWFEPLLVDANPFYGASSRITLAEVSLGGLVSRLLGLPAKEILYPGLPQMLQEQTPNFWRWSSAVFEHPSVSEFWDADWFAEIVRRKGPQKKAEAAAAAAN